MTVSVGNNPLDDVGSHDLPTLQALRGIVDRVRSKVDATLPTPPDLFVVDNRPASIRKLAASWRAVVPLLDQIEPIFADLSDELQTILVDQTRTPQWQQDATSTAMTAATSAAINLGERIEAGCTSLLNQARRLALPTRPQPADALQEAQLAGLKADLRLLASSINTSGDLDGTGFTDMLAARLSAAAAAGDNLAVWLIATSDWPLSILAPALGYHGATADALRARWSQTTADVIAAGNPDAAAAITAYRVLSDPQALPALVVVTGSFIRQVTSDVADYVTHSQPWT